MIASLVILAALFGLAVQAGAQPIPITECFQVIRPGRVGVLQNDLDCTGLTPPQLCDQTGTPCSTDADCEGVGDLCTTASGVVLKGNSLRSARLRLNGLTILGDPWAVRCIVRCRINGPGEISSTLKAINNSISGRRQRTTRLSVNDVTLRDSPFAIWGGRVRARNVLVTNSGSAANCAISASRVRGSNLTITGGPRCGILSDTLRGLDGLTVTGFPDLGVWLSGTRPVVKNATITGNGTGISSNGRCRVQGSTVIGNSKGIRCGKVVLDDSVAVDNPDAAGIDVESERKPVLSGTATCGNSLNPATGVSWGVCTND